MSEISALRLSVIGLLVMALSACTDPVPPPLTPEQRATYRVETVDVRTGEAVEIWWGRGDDQVLEELGIEAETAEDRDAVLETPDAQRRLGELAAERVAPRLKAETDLALTGQSPAHLAVRLTNVFVASIAQQTLVGGNHVLFSDMQLFDATTGEALTLPQPIRVLEAGSGILSGIVDNVGAEPIDQLGSRLGQAARIWLIADRPRHGLIDPVTAAVEPLPPPEIAPVPETEDAVPSS